MSDAYDREVQRLGQLLIREEIKDLLRDNKDIKVEYVRNPKNYVYDENGFEVAKGDIIGTIVAVDGQLGWSMRVKGDKYDKYKGIFLSLRRASLPPTPPPHAIAKQYEEVKFWVANKLSV